MMSMKAGVVTHALIIVQWAFHAYTQPSETIADSKKTGSSSHLFTMAKVSSLSLGIVYVRYILF